MSDNNDDQFTTALVDAEQQIRTARQLHDSGGPRFRISVVLTSARRAIIRAEEHNNESSAN